MFIGNSKILQPSRPPINQTPPKPFVQITEQPSSRAVRFRYACEGPSAGSISGVYSTPEKKTFPTIQVLGYKGPAMVVVSCVTKEEPYRPHPYNLVGRKECQNGVCTMKISPSTMKATFSNLGIHIVKKKEIKDSLKLRKEDNVDPYQTGFGHMYHPNSIDLNAVRLCFQVFLEGESKGRFNVPLRPVVSDIIYDKKVMHDLLIVKLSHCSSYVDGDREVILLCEKVVKEDIQIRFFEEKNGETVWKEFGQFQQSNVHKQTAICFRTPRYHTLDITEPVRVFIQLLRPSDGATSDALPFELLPLDFEPGALKKKRQKFYDSNYFLRQVEDTNGPSQPCLLNIPMDPMKVDFCNVAPLPYGEYMYDKLNISCQYSAVNSTLSKSLFTPQQNIPSTSTGNTMNIQQNFNTLAPVDNHSAKTINLGNISEISSLLPLDNHKQLPEIEINSDDLSVGTGTNNLSETLIQLSVSDD